MKLASKDMTRLNPQIKHFAVKYHWFRSKFKSPYNKIKMMSIDMSFQKADILLKVSEEKL